MIFSCVRAEATTRGHGLMDRTAMVLVLLTAFSRLGLADSPPPILPGRGPGFNEDPNYLFMALLGMAIGGVCIGWLGRPSKRRFSSRPPIDAKYLFHIFLNRQNCDALVGDLEERYRLIRKQFGQRRADLWYWIQTMRSVEPIMWRAIRKLSGLAMLWELYRRIRS